MRIKFRLLLPAIQIAMAVLLLVLGEHQRAAHRGQDMYFGPPAAWICYALNAPATVFRSGVMYLWNELGRPFASHVIAIDNAIFFFGLGVVWSLVRVVADSWFRKRRNIVSAMPAGPLRLVGDLGLVGLGVAFIVLVGYGTRDLLRMQSAVAAALESGLWAIWGLALVIICGRDFIRGISARRKVLHA